MGAAADAGGEGGGMTTCNITEAARLLKVHEETVAEMIRECKLPAAKVGRATTALITALPQPQKARPPARW